MNAAVGPLGKSFSTFKFNLLKLMKLMKPLSWRGVPEVHEIL